MHFTPTSGTHVHEKNMETNARCKKQFNTTHTGCKNNSFSEVLEHSRKNAFATDCMGLDLKGLSKRAAFSAPVNGSLDVT